VPVASATSSAVCAAGPRNRPPGSALPPVVVLGADGPR
jgi:hypothetical protein